MSWFHFDTGCQITSHNKSPVVTETPPYYTPSALVSAQGMLLMSYRVELYIK